MKIQFCMRVENNKEVHLMLAWLQVMIVKRNKNNK